MLTNPPRGFGMIELVIALAIVAILASFAIPGFTQVLQRSRRMEAVAALMEVQLAQERFRSAHAAYAPELNALGIDADVAAHYRLAIAAAGAQRYTAVATAIGAQAGDRACTQLGLTLTGGTLSLHSAGTATPDTCWRR